MKNTIGSVVVSIFFIACSSTKKTIQKDTNKILFNSFFDNQFTGFLVVGVDKKDTIYQYNSRKYFIPASNVKIFTLYTALKLLPERLPALKYIIQNDTLYLEGTGDPTFLHNYFSDGTTFNFLKQSKNIALHVNNFYEEKFGPGWAWEDYQYYYQPERSAFPIYGNVNRIFRIDSISVTPKYFADSTFEIASLKAREKDRNIFYYAPERKDTIEVPFITDISLTQTLIEKVLNKKIHLIDEMPIAEKSVLNGIQSDTVYRRMMLESDNFLAEQLLILASSTLSDSLSIAKVQNYVLENHLSNLRQPPRWVDGSGLSRYNLFTPENMVHVLSKMYHDNHKANLFTYFNEYGELVKRDNKSTIKPYIFAKSGGMGNIYNLSGYLKTKSGKILVFSFMNNHYRKPTGEIKKRMQRIFESLRDNY